jgi:hypothetical protein
MNGRCYVPFSGYAFSAVNYCWLKPLLRFEAGKSKPKPTPLVSDVYARSCRERDVESFVERINRAGYNKSKNLPILGLVAAPHFEEAAWKMAKKAGLICLNMTTTFGEQVLNAIAAMEEILKSVVGNPELSDESEFCRLSGLLKELKDNPLIVQLRSMGFEAAAGLILRTKNWENVKLGIQVPFGNETRDIDVYGERENGAKATLIECKAALSGVELDPGHVSRFFQQTVPAYLKSMGHENGVKHCCAEIWTTGTVGTKAVECLRDVKLDSRVSPDLVDGTKLNGTIPNSISRVSELLTVIAGDI